MTLKDDVVEMKKELKEVREESIAMELIKDYKKDKKRLFVILIVILSMWFATIGLFVYYINTTGYEEITEISDTSDGGNACVGDNCNNGVINGESN